jgi:hypothetical protein
MKKISPPNIRICLAGKDNKMAMSDPFGVTANLAERGISGGISNFVDPVYTQVQRKQQQAHTQNMLRQMGILRDVEEPYTLEELQKHATKLGGEINLSKDIPENEQLSKATQLAQAAGLMPPPKRKTIFDAGLAAEAGVSLNPYSGEMVMAPKKQEAPTFGIYTTTPEGEVKKSGEVPKGSKVISKTGSGFGAANIEEAKRLAPSIYEAVKGGDVSGYMGATPQTKQVIASLAASEGTNLDDLVLGYNAEKTAVGNIRIVENKVASAISAQTLLDAYFDPKTNEYKVPPAQHSELAIAGARLLSPQGVIPYDMVQDLRQKTAREAFASVLIYGGADPREVGGSTQSVINMFADMIKREGLAAENMRNVYRGGRTVSYSDMLNKKSSVLDTPQGQAMQSANTGNDPLGIRQ